MSKGSPPGPGAWRGLDFVYAAILRGGQCCRIIIGHEEAAPEGGTLIEALTYQNKRTIDACNLNIVRINNVTK